MSKIRSIREGQHKRRITWVCKSCETRHDKKVLGLKKRPVSCLVCKCPRDFYYFASRAELIRFGELRLQEQLGEIVNLKMQVKFPLYGVRRGDSSVIVPEHYVCDFEYIENGVRIVEDVKGSVRAITELSSSKIKRFERQEGFKVRIVFR